MALIKCPECGKEISDTCDHCIHCGYRLKKKRFGKILNNNKYGLKYKKVNLILLASFILSLIVTLSIPSPTSYKNGRVLTCKDTYNATVTDYSKHSDITYHYYFNYSLKVEDDKIRIWGTETVKNGEGTTVYEKYNDGSGYYEILADGSLKVNRTIFKKEGWLLTTDYQFGYIPPRLYGYTENGFFWDSGPSPTNTTIRFTNYPCYFSKLVFVINTSIIGIGFLCIFGKSVYKKQKSD